jgi:hypothetical protein
MLGAELRGVPKVAHMNGISFRESENAMMLPPDAYDWTTAYFRKYE